MKPAPFDYHAPTSLTEALDLLAGLDGDVKPLAGGQSLVPLLALRMTRFDHLVDLNRVPDLAGIVEDGDGVVVSAMTRQSTVEHDPTVRSLVPLLSEATVHIGHRAIRNRGTIGGSISHADPASEYPAVAMALGATMELASSSGRRSVTADDFFLGMWTTAIQDDELLVSMRYPVWGAGSGFGVAETARRSGDFAIAGAVGGVQVAADGTVVRAAIALMGMADRPHRGVEAEQALVGATVTDLTPAALAEVADLAVRGTDPSDDIHASASYRRKVGSFMVQDALTRALAAVQEP